MKIDIHGAKVHNLKDVDVSIPKEKLTVVTGLSGSGKSSLAFDTLYAEGQRRYVESPEQLRPTILGALGQTRCRPHRRTLPAVAIEQRSASGGPRSTVATRTEIMDHLRMLFARIGVTKSPISGEVVRKDRVTDVVDHILACGAERMMLVAPLAPEDDRSPEDQLRVLQQQGYTRVWTAEGAMRMDSLDGPRRLGPGRRPLFPAIRRRGRRPRGRQRRNGPLRRGRTLPSVDDLKGRQGRVRGIQRPLRTGRHGLP